MAKVNNQECSWGDISVVVAGSFVVGLDEITYTSTKGKSLSYGAGRTPLSIQHGKREYSGTLAIKESELRALNAAAQAQGYKDILDLEFDIVVQYMLEGSSTVTIDNIVCASFSELPKGAKSGDDELSHQLKFICLDIEYGA